MIIENEFYTANVSFGVDNLVNMRFTAKKQLPHKLLKKMLNHISENIFYIFLADCEKDVRALFPETTAHEITDYMTDIRFLYRLKNNDLPLINSYIFPLEKLYNTDDFERRLILNDYNSKETNNSMSELTLMLLTVLEHLRQNPYTPYMDYLESDIFSV